jgi:peptidoglycan/LPS O-acetylase OafA/YrhL
MEARKPARLNALTGLRTSRLSTSSFFIFPIPNWFGWLAPVVNAGYASVSFFILLSGFVLAYNYAGPRPRGQAGQGASGRRGSRGSIRSTC